MEEALAGLSYDLEVHGLELSKVDFLGCIHDLYADDLLPRAHIQNDVLGDPPVGDFLRAGVEPDVKEISSPIKLYLHFVSHFP